MNCLVTGAKGFVGRNLCARLRSEGHNVLEYDLDSTAQELDRYCAEADFVFNLAGVNRPQNPEEFMAGNFGFASQLLDALKRHGNRCPVMISSSTQAALDNPYGESKRAGEELMRAYGAETGAKVLIYRFPNLFGKWCRPNYNSAVATFCHNKANGLPITVNNPATELTLVYIDDLCDELLAALNGREHRDGDFCRVAVEHKATLGHIVELLDNFVAERQQKSLIQTNDPFAKALYSTYLSYLPTNGFSYELKMNQDQRGSFTEIFRTSDRGQVSINVSKPGFVKGNHWHHTKIEKFMVVSGQGLFQFRKIGTDEVIEYRTSGHKLEVIDIPPGYTHNIINLSDTDDLVTLIWCNEIFDPEHPDTIYETV